MERWPVLHLGGWVVKRRCKITKKKLKWQIFFAQLVTITNKMWENVVSVLWYRYKFQ